jgi:hypothetical protein
MQNLVVFAGGAEGSKHGLLTALSSQHLRNQSQRFKGACWGTICRCVRPCVRVRISVAAVVSAPSRHSGLFRGRARTLWMRARA